MEQLVATLRYYEDEETAEVNAPDADDLTAAIQQLTVVRGAATL